MPTGHKVFDIIVYAVAACLGALVAGVFLLLLSAFASTVALSVIDNYRAATAPCRETAMAHECPPGSRVEKLDGAYICRCPVLP